MRGSQREVLLAVAGAHLTGLPLNGELTSRGARLVGTAKTAAEYRFYALAGTSPAKPGLVRSPGFSGPGIEVELWALGRDAFGSFVAGVPAPMVIGNVTLDDGRVVKSFCASLTPSREAKRSRLSAAFAPFSRSARAVADARDTVCPGAGSLAS